MPAFDRGHYATVNVCTNINTNERFAVKRIRKRDLVCLDVLEKLFHVIVVDDVTLEIGVSYCVR